jgi:hypothetical protein
MEDHCRHCQFYLLPSQPVSGTAGQYKVYTAIVTESEQRSFVVNIHGYSKLKGLLKNGECVASLPLSVEGHNWFLRYYPNGHSQDRAAYVYLLLDSVDGKYVTAEARNIDVLDEFDTPTRAYLGTMLQMNLSENSSYLGYHIHGEKLEQSGCIIGDCLLSSRIFVRKHLVISLLWFLQPTCIGILATS